MGGENYLAPWEWFRFSPGPRITLFIVVFVLFVPAVIGGRRNGYLATTARTMGRWAGIFCKSSTRQGGCPSASGIKGTRRTRPLGNDGPVKRLPRAAPNDGGLGGKIPRTSEIGPRIIVSPSGLPTRSCIPYVGSDGRRSERRRRCGCTCTRSCACPTLMFLSCRRVIS